ncbi:uncharacterized protein [Nothobranchius furzeri]|uniref:uncharacterized protein isoform X1 n=1 Tax=Nothobranchius furzeri TaxID=105023 RepID=UPI0024044E23|nr:uncharacterized protein LOC107396545 isoform X4 [Nothobranchius furzeri]
MSRESVSECYDRSFINTLDAMLSLYTYPWDETSVQIQNARSSNPPLVLEPMKQRQQYDRLVFGLSPVHREGGFEAGSGGLGEEHVWWDGGGPGPGSSPLGGGDEGLVE